MRDPFDTKRTEPKTKVSASAKMPPWWKATEANQHIVDAYLALHSLKASFDVMEEIPNSVIPLYDQILRALGSLEPAQKSLYQLSMTVRAAANKYR